MILRTRLSHFFLSLFIFTAFTAAWPWPPSYADIEGFLLRRDDTNSDSASPSQSATQGSSAAASSDQNTSPSGSAAATTGGSAAATSNSPTGKTQSGSNSGSKPAETGSKATGKNSASATPTVTDVDPRLPAGGVNMLTPSALATTTYYKVGEPVTFGWNYTSLSIPPSKIDVVVTCTDNNAVYTLSNNVSFASTGSAIWNTVPEETGQAPLLTGEYNLLIYDAAKDPSAVAPAGHLGGSNPFKFAMYVRESYTSVADGWICAVCSAALSDTERQALKFMFAMAGITVLSFTWFVGGLGALV